MEQSSNAGVGGMAEWGALGTLGAGQGFGKVPEIKGKDVSVQEQGANMALLAQAMDFARGTVRTHGPYLEQPLL